MGIYKIYVCYTIYLQQLTLKYDKFIYDQAINYHKRTNEKSLISLNEACMQRGVSLGLYLSIKREKAGEGGGLLNNQQSNYPRRNKTPRSIH